MLWGVAKRDMSDSIAISTGFTGRRCIGHSAGEGDRRQKPKVVRKEGRARRQKAEERRQKSGDRRQKKGAWTEKRTGRKKKGHNDEK